MEVGRQLEFWVTQVSLDQVRWIRWNIFIMQLPVLCNSMVLFFVTNCIKNQDIFITFLSLFVLPGCIHDSQFHMKGLRMNLTLLYFCWTFVSLLDLKFFHYDECALYSWSYPTFIYFCSADRNFSTNFAVTFRILYFTSTSKLPSLIGSKTISFNEIFYPFKKGWILNSLGLADYW